MTEATQPKKRAVFFDRDGIINRRIKDGYVRNWDEFEFLQHVGDVLKAVKQKGYLAIVITNQRGVGRGLMTEADLIDIHERLQRHVEWNFDAKFDDIIYCTDPDDSSLRRKPSPAMLHEAADKWNIDLPSSWMLGDSTSDVEAGTAAGTKTAYLLNQFTTRIPEATVVLGELSEFPKHL